MDPITGCVVPYTPQGRFLHIPPPLPRTDWATDFGQPWWRDEATYGLGNLTRRSRFLRVVNILSSQEQQIEVRHPMLAMSDWCAMESPDGLATNSDSCRGSDSRKTRGER